MPGHIRGGQIWGTHPRNRSGGADGIRTHDLLDAIEARSQLRHGPTGENAAACSYSTRAQRASTHASGACAQDQNSFEIAAELLLDCRTRSSELETFQRQILTPTDGKTVAPRALPTTIPPHAQNHFSWRRRHGYRLKISDRSGRQTAAG